jgi:hypothetical protein
MHQCPVCGFAELKEPPRAASGGGSYEICPSCGFQFGVDDDDRGLSDEQAREAWIAKGMPWRSKSRAAPKGWDAEDQLQSLLRTEKKSKMKKTASSGSDSAAKPKAKSKSKANANANATATATATAKKTDKARPSDQR